MIKFKVYSKKWSEIRDHTILAFGFVFLSAMALPQLASAQMQEITGLILDSTAKEPVAGANILLSNSMDNSFIQGTTTDANGKFTFKAEPGNYMLTIKFLSYKDYNLPVKVMDQTVNLKTIFLADDFIQLNDVNIVEKVTPVLQNGDTTQYNAAAFKTNPDANAENLLEKMPGVVIQNGKVQAQGEDVKQVLVDGKPFFGNDPNAALKNLPAEIIDKIQVFDDQSDESKLTGYDDGNTTKTINIITKKEFRNGVFGNLYGGYGIDNKYLARGTINYFNDDQRITIMGQSNNINEQNFSSEDLAGVSSSSGGRGGSRGGGRGRRGGGFSSTGGDISDFLVNGQNGINRVNAFGLNYSDDWGKKISLTGSYFLNTTNNSVNSKLVRQFFSDNSKNQIYKENETSESQNINHRFNWRMKYEIDSNNTIIIRPRFSLQINNGTSHLGSSIFLSDTLLNQNVNNYSSEVMGWNLSNSLLWRHKFETRGRSLSLNLSQNINNNTAQSNLLSVNAYQNNDLLDTIHQASSLDQFEQQYDARIMYTEPLSEALQLRLNYNPSISFNKSNKETFDFESSTEDYTLPNTLLSNKNKSEYRTQEGGAGLSLRKGSSAFMVSGSYQWAKLTADQVYPEATSINKTYATLLPMAMWRYRFSKKNNLRLFYRTQTVVPRISQLQEVVDNSNPLQLSTGNANLDQQYQHNLFLRYSASNSVKSSSFFVLLGGTYTNNYITNSTITAYGDTLVIDGIRLSPGMQLKRPVNLNGQYNVRFFTSYGLPIHALKSNLNFNLSAQLSHNPGIINGDLNMVDAPNLGLGVVLSSNIGNKIDFTISSNSSQNYSFNSLNKDLNSQYFNQNTRVNLYWNFWKYFTYRAMLNHQFYAGLSNQLNNNFWLWNMGLGTKLFKSKQGEITLSVFDLLNQNNNLSRNTTETYYEDVETNILQRYFLLSFTYKIKAFKSANKG